VSSPTPFQATRCGCTFDQHPSYLSYGRSVQVLIRAQRCLTSVIKWVPVCPKSKDAGCRVTFEVTLGREKHGLIKIKFNYYKARNLALYNYFMSIALSTYLVRFVAIVHVTGCPSDFGTICTFYTITMCTIQTLEKKVIQDF
jgi:hypothetical protein